jgi:hypothetical protein
LVNSASISEDIVNGMMKYRLQFITAYTNSIFTFVARVIQVNDNINISLWNKYSWNNSLQSSYFHIIVHGELLWLSICHCKPEIEIDLEVTEFEAVTHKWLFPENIIFVRRRKKYVEALHCVKCAQHSTLPHVSHRCMLLEIFFEYF